ncbi:MAG: HlyC/CorC family transporter [Eubacteriaceae bacterium]|nr:HlyC/CorC family transporter [Eubacteriaceae bacterium]
MVGQLLLLALLILLNAFFAASEIAMISLNDTKIKNMADDGDKKSIKLVKLLKEPGKFLATIQIGITFAGFLASAFASQSFADNLAELVVKAGLPLNVSMVRGLSVMIITLLLSYFSLVLGELVPKRIAMQNPEKISFFAIGPLTVISKVASPFVKFLNFSANFFIKLTGGDPHASEQRLTEEEIRMMIDVGEEKGAIQRIEKELINNIFDFNDKYASDIMTHRTEVLALPKDAGLEEVIKLYSEEKYTRIPIYKENIDNIIGILHVKDVIEYFSGEKDSDFSIERLMRKPVYVPESKPIDKLFREIQRSKVHMVIVIDEYGGTSGIITIEDMIEEIMGNIFDEYDVVEDEYRKIDENSYYFDGGIDLDSVAEILDIELPIRDYDTLSGYLVSLIGRIPLDGDKTVIRERNITYKIIKAEDKKITEVEVSIDKSLLAQTDQNNEGRKE